MKKNVPKEMCQNSLLAAPVYKSNKHQLGKTKEPSSLAEEETKQPLVSTNKEVRYPHGVLQEGTRCLPRRSAADGSPRCDCVSRSLRPSSALRGESVRGVVLRHGPPRWDMQAHRRGSELLLRRIIFCLHRCPPASSLIYLWPLWVAWRMILRI